MDRGFYSTANINGLYKEHYKFLIGVKPPVDKFDFRLKLVIHELKERLSMRRMLVSSELSLEGKLFVQFVALIYLSYLKKTMKDQRLFGTYTIQGVLDQLDNIECFERPGCVLRIGEITKRQQELFQKLGVAPPTSL